MFKTAVTVAQLRTAVQAFKDAAEKRGVTWLRNKALLGSGGRLVKPRVRVGGRSMGQAYMPAAGVTTASPEILELVGPELGTRLKNIENTIVTGGAKNPEMFVNYLRQANKFGRLPAKTVEQMPAAMKSMGITTVPDLPYRIPTKPILALKSPASREAFNRAIILHEAAEVSKKHPGVLKTTSELMRRNPEASKFMGHLSVTPPLRDLNIAATLEGAGPEASHAIRAMRRAEVATLNAMGFKDLNLGKERVSRHAVKRIQQAINRRSEATMNWRDQQMRSMGLA